MQFEPNKPFTTAEKTVVVDAGLALGPHTFRLEVVNTRGQRSQPVEVTVTVVRLIPVPTSIPTPIPTPIPRPPIG